MKKTLGLLALTVSLGAAGCAMLPHATKAPGATARTGLSGLGTAVITNLPGSGYGVQAVGNGAKLVVARVYTPDTTYGANYAAITSSLEKDPLDASKVLLATASVVSGVAKLTLPALPSGDHIIKLDAYSTLNPAITWATGVESDQASASADLVAQSETLVTADIGLPYTATFPIFSTFKYRSNIDASASVNATASQNIAGLLPGTAGLFLRAANWNPYASLTASQTVRVTIVHPTAFPSALASGSTSAYWTLGDVRAARGFSATQSFPAWSWDSKRKYLYSDVDFTALTSYAAYHATDSVTTKDVGAFSLVLPAAFVPAGYVLNLTDVSSGSSLAAPTTL